MIYFFFFKQKTAYEMRISDWSSDVCSSDLKRPNNNIRSLAQLNAQLRPIEPQDERRITTQMQHHVSKTPQSQLTPDRDPPRPPREFLQRSHAQDRKSVV